MKIVAFNLLKIHAEKTSQNLIENLKVNTNIDISDIKEVKSDMFNSKESLLAINFQYIIEYEPKFANLSFTGIVLISLSQKEAKDLLKEWENNKIPEEFKLPLFNTILKKSNLRALQLEDELALPPHIPLPSLKASIKK